MKPTAEQQRLASANSGKEPWRRWGLYLSERQWGTVREDYSPHGNAWEYLPHDHARSRAYRWGEDGLAGISDDQQRICLSLALWNGPRHVGRRGDLSLSKRGWHTLPVQNTTTAPGSAAFSAGTPDRRKLLPIPIPAVPVL